MPYAPPVVFVTATALDADSVQSNNDALKVYIDGNVVAGDVSTAAWIRAPHIMRGTFIPLWNLHEFTTGVVRGAIYNTNDITISADRFRMPYPSFLTGNEVTSIEFHNESAFFSQRLGWQVYPKHLPVLTTPTTTVGQVAEITLGGLYKAYTCQENDAGTYRGNLVDFGLGIPGIYRRRAVQCWEYEETSGAALGLTKTKTFYVGTNTVVNDYADFGYCLEVFYE